MTIVIPRATWGARYANGCEVIGTSEWVAAGLELWLHHSTTNPPGPDATLDQDCQHMRDFEAIGESRFGCGISYTWVVMPSGRVFQGHDTDRQGTHTYGRNNSGRAICLAGNYQTQDVPQRMRDSVALLLRELGGTLDGGHRDVYPTDCPGDRAYAIIGALNSLATSGAPIGVPETRELPDLSGFNGYGLQVVSGPLTFESDGYAIPLNSAWLVDLTNGIVDYYDDATSLRTACKDAGVMHVGCSGRNVKNLLVKFA